MSEKDDWRLQGQERYLKGITLYWRQYSRYSEDWDHDHCAFCWKKFMEVDHPETLHEGYTTENEYYWVCKVCFEDFRDRFHWRVGRPKI